MRQTPWTDSGLGQVLADLRRAEENIEAPSHVEAVLMAEWDKAHASMSRRTPWHEAAAIAAGITIAVGLWQLGNQLHQATRQPSSHEDSRTLLVVGEPILQGEPVRMVRMRVPASTLAGLGVRTVAVEPGAQVDVDVIVGEDGVARAIRVGM